MEAVYRLTGKRLPEDYTTEQVNNFLTVELFNTSLWHKYRKIYNEVSNEKEIVVENYSYQYTLVVELANKSNLSLDEGKIVHFVMCELLGNPCETYKGMKNPIILYEKIMIDKAKTLDECFKELILKRGWSKNSPYDRRTASRHKKQFLEGTLPDEFKRVYLQSAGYTIVQPELWRQEL